MKAGCVDRAEITPHLLGESYILYRPVWGRRFPGPMQWHQGEIDLAQPIRQIQV